MPNGHKKDKNRLIDTCTCCNIEKSIIAFGWRIKSKGIRQSQCLKCLCDKEKQKYLNDSALRQRKRMVTKQWKKDHPKQVKFNSLLYRQRHPERIAANSHKQYLKDPKGVYIRSQEWARAHPEIMNAKTSRRRAALLRRVPVWSENEAIKQFYANCPPGMTVDHIVPLQGKLVSGLHVLSNLQYLTPSGNYKKRNKFNPIGFNNRE